MYPIRIPANIKPDYNIYISIFTNPTKKKGRDRETIEDSVK